MYKLLVVGKTARNIVKPSGEVFVEGKFGFGYSLRPCLRGKNLRSKCRI